MWRKSSSLVLILFLVGVLGACSEYGLDYGPIRPVTQPTPLPVVMGEPTREWNTPTPRPTREAKATPRPAPVLRSTPLPTKALPTPTLRPTPTPTPEPTRQVRVTPTPTPEPTSVPRVDRERAIYMASRGLGLARQNLEGADLSNHSWQGVNFNYANLKGANFTGADLTRATLRYADLTGANFTGADMTGTDMTGAETKSAIFKDLSKLNWIDRELALTGELPRLPNWMFPPLMEDVFVNGSDKGDRVEKGQDFWIERGDWCDLSPTQRLMIEEYIIWQGYKFQDWLEEPPSIGLVYDRCPPAEGY